MGFLNILGYIGIGLAAAVLLFFIDMLTSKVRRPCVDENGNYVGDELDLSIGMAFVKTVLEMLIIGAVMLCNLAHLKVLLAIGIAFLGAIVYSIVVAILDHIIVKVWKCKDDEDKEAVMGLFCIITCLLNGAGFGILVHHWGWF